jgi:uncharacterized protein (DUF433 family)
MISIPAAVTVPLRTDADGVIRVGQTRVTLMSVIADFQRGASPEEIAHHFPVLDVSDVYLVVGYYLQHREEVETYIRQERAASEQLRQELADIFPNDGLRARVLAKLAARKPQE